MFDPNTYKDRRSGLIEQLGKGIVILLGNELSPMNCADNVYPFRQDSSFLYYIGLDQPQLAAILDLDEGTTTLFGNDPSIEDVVWTGPQLSLTELGARSGILRVADYGQLAGEVARQRSKDRPIHILPPYRPENRILLATLLQCPLPEVAEFISEDLIRAIVAQRAIKTPDEVREIEKAVNTTRSMHLAAMQQARPGLVEAELAGLVEGLAVAGGGNLAYPVILTVNGQTLHNHYHGNTLKSGQLVLGDFGAETAMHYAGDITRTFPVDPTFTAQQRAIYDIVLRAETEVIEALKPGIPYRDMHKKAARILTSGLNDLGLMKGDVEEAVEAGAHALFFPHGLGHMMGLDVHDMEDLGEDLVGYDEEVKRDPRFGYKSLRLGRRLQAGFVLTVEPGIYFIPQLIDLWKAEGKFKDFINYTALEAYRDFSGVRIEDNVLITDQGYRILGEPIPKTIAQVEEIPSR